MLTLSRTNSLAIALLRKRRRDDALIADYINHLSMAGLSLRADELSNLF
jgi:hypothetical protein